MNYFYENKGKIEISKDKRKRISKDNKKAKKNCFLMIEKYNNFKLKG